MGDGDAPRSRERLSDFHRRFGALSGDAVDLGFVVVERVVKGHAASYDRGKGIVAQDRAKTLPAKANGDRGSDFVRSQNDCVRIRPICEKAPRGEIVHAETPFDDELSKGRAKASEALY